MTKRAGAMLLSLIAGAVSIGVPATVEAGLSEDAYVRTGCIGTDYVIHNYGPDPVWTERNGVAPRTELAAGASYVAPSGSTSLTAWLDPVSAAGSELLTEHWPRPAGDATVGRVPACPTSGDGTNRVDLLLVATCDGGPGYSSGLVALTSAAPNSEFHVEIDGPDGSVAGDWAPGDQSFTLSQEDLDFIGAGAVTAGFGDEDAPGAWWPMNISTAPCSDYVPVVPGRLLDTRENGRTVDGFAEGGGIVPAGVTVELHVTERQGVPFGAGLVAINVAVTNPQGSGFLTVYPCDSARPGTVSLNFRPGASLSNGVLARVGGEGTVCIYTSAPANMVADVSGYFPATGNVVSLLPVRFLDTRAAGNTIDGAFRRQGVRPAGSVTEFDVRGRADVEETAVTVSLNVAVTSPTSSGFLTVYPCDVARPGTASLNFGAVSSLSNNMLVQIGANDRVCVYTSATNIVADVNGFFTASSDLVSLVPARLLDTRPNGATIDGQFRRQGPRPARSVTEFVVAGRGGVGTASTTVALNVVVTQPVTSGYLTVYPCGSPRPGTASVNYRAGASLGNGSLVKVGAGGKVCVYTSAATNLVADVSGAFVDGSTDVTFTPIADDAEAVGTMTQDGRYLSAVSGADWFRLDMVGGGVSPLPFRGLFTADGSAIVGSPDNVVTRHDVGPGQDTTYAPPPDDWIVSAVTGLSGDGRYVGVEASNGVAADVATFVLDTTTNTWTRPDEALGGAATSNSSYAMLISTDASMAVFDFQDAPVGCSACVDVWAATPVPTLVSPTAAGQTSANGSSRVQDISSNGRFVLFRSTSTDLAGGPGHPSGRLYVRDRVTQTTSVLPVAPSTQHVTSATISDDGTRIALAVDHELSNGGDVFSVPVPALYDRMSGRTTLLTQDSTTAAALRGNSPVEISGDGRRVVFAAEEILRVDLQTAD